VSIGDRLAVRRFDLSVYVTDSDEFDVEYMHKSGQLDKALLWKQTQLVYNWDEGNERAANITLSPEQNAEWFNHLQGNGSLYAHTFFVRRGSPILPSAPKYNRLSVNYAVRNSTISNQRAPSSDISGVAQMTQLNVYKPRPKMHARKNLISGEFEVCTSRYHANRRSCACRCIG
jgi:hypothetical protein